MLDATKGTVAIIIARLKGEVKSFQCEICTHISKSKYDLKLHVEGVHEKIRNKECKECGSAFYRTGDLNSHVNTVHKKPKNVSFKYCSFSASGKGNLNQHVVAKHSEVTGEKVTFFQCYQCPFKSPQNAWLGKHIKKVHEKINDHIC